MAQMPVIAKNFDYTVLGSEGEPEQMAIPIETAMAISYNGISYAVMMASPAHIEDFVVGFSLTQGIIESVRQVRSIDVTFARNEVLVEVQLSARAQWHYRTQQRRLAGASGCGICGVDALEAALPDLSVLPPAALPDKAHFMDLRDRIRAYQSAIEQSGAQHAALFVRPDGEIAHCREDIGRHNAMDKLIGSLLRSGEELTQGFVILTSRCGLELVQKAIRAGIPTLATLSAPTSLAVEWARRYQLNLIHVPHHSAPRVYCTGASYIS